MAFFPSFSFLRPDLSRSQLPQPQKSLEEVQSLCSWKASIKGAPDSLSEVFAAQTRDPPVLCGTFAEAFVDGMV